LPFTLRARAQGNLLLAKKALGEQRNRAALELVRKSLELDAGDGDARLFFTDALAANGEFSSAVHVLEELVADGADRQSELAGMYKRAAIGELVMRNQSAALEYFRLARDAGLTDEELGSGADKLHEGALKSMKDGSDAFAAGDLDQARTHYEHALRYDSSLLVVHSQLAVVLFQQKEFLPAATHWREVLDTAIAEELELPDPTHIFLAKALFAAQDKLAAKRVLELYLERQPQGKWVESTTALLGELK
jgi:tetratricopeptide (TPR) repeat protein